MWASPTLGATGGVAVVGRGGRLAQRVFEQGGRIALARFDRRDGRQRGSSTRPSWKRGGKVAASTSTRPGWKRGGKAASFYVHAPKLEARRQGGQLLRPRAQAGNAAARRPASGAWRPRARAGNAAARRPASTSTRPGWKRGGKLLIARRSPAWIYVHAPGLETRRQGGLLLRPRAQAGSAAVRWLGLLKKEAGRSPTFWRRSDQRRPRQAEGGKRASQASGEAGRGAEPGGATWRVAPRASPPEGFGLGRSRGWSGEHSKRQICRLPLVACFCPTAPAAQSAASTAERSPARPPSATRGSSDPTVPSAV